MDVTNTPGTLNPQQTSVPDFVAEEPVVAFQDVFKFEEINFVVYGLSHYF